MLLWTIAIVLFALLGLIGYSLGAIRMSVSLIGLFVAALLARPLGHLFTPIVTACGAKDPLLIWVLGPAIAFIVVAIVFNVIGITVHHKIDVYYKYKAGDIRMGLFNRVNTRLGLVMGMPNAAFYLVLIVKVVYPFSYATTEVATGDNLPFTVKLLNTLGRNIQSAGMSKVASALDPMPPQYYQAMDIIGLIYHNDLLEGRLSHYPAFLTLGERSEFQDIGNDKEFMELRQSQPPIADILSNPKVETILNNPDLLRQIWATIEPNLPDLMNYLKTGQSAKYDSEPILGRWAFDMVGALNNVKRSDPRITVQKMTQTRELLQLSFAKTTFTATPEPDRLAILKDVGKVHPPSHPKEPPTVELQNFKGTWVNDNGKYELSFPDKASRGSLEAVVEGDRMTINGDVFPMVFEREY